MPTQINDALNALKSVNNIGFAQFTTQLIDGVFNSIVDSSIKQMSAYAGLVSSVSKSLNDFVTEALGPNNSNVALVIENDFGLAISGSGNSRSVAVNAEQRENLIATFKDIKVSNKAIEDSGNLSTPDNAGNSTITFSKIEPFVVKKIQDDATSKFEMLRTLLQLGMQKVVVDRGHIKTKLTFSVDASQSNSRRAKSFHSDSSTSGIAGGVLGGFFAGKAGAVGGIGGFDSDKIVNVNVVNERSSAAINLSADIVGEVLVQFRTDSFPIAKF